MISTPTTLFNDQYKDKLEALKAFLNGYTFYQKGNPIPFNVKDFAPNTLVTLFLANDNSITITTPIPSVKKSSP